jgi:hypothetical protein
MSHGSRPFSASRGRLALLPALAALASAACGQKLQEQYGVQIVGPVGIDYLAGARTMVLDVGNKELSRTTIEPGAPFDLSGAGIDPGTMRSGVIKLRALDGNGAVVAYGESPEIELSLYSPPLLRVFVQKPGSFGRTVVLDSPRRGVMAVAAVAAPPADSAARPISVAFYGTGRVTGVMVGSNPPVMVEVASDLLRIYNPLLHEHTDPAMTGAIGGIRQPRTDVAAVVQADNTIYVFGGLVPATSAIDRPHVTSQLDVLRVVRPTFDSFEQRVPTMARDTDKPGIARSKTVLAIADATYAFGGEADGTQLDTVVQLNPAMTDAFLLLEQKMGAARVGHTATRVNSAGTSEVLIFGGDHADAAVAEVFVPGVAPKFVKPTGDPGPTRWDHAAIPLQGGRSLLIIGGKTAGGAPVGTTLLYSAADRVLGPGPITLAVPRSEFAAFVVGNDLVVAGGIDGNGQRIDNAEVFTVTDADVKPRAMVRAEKRSGAAVSVLANGSAVLLGGTGADGAASSIVEIYQPFQ